jgi:hypothetical protein
MSDASPSTEAWCPRCQDFPGGPDLTYETPAAELDWDSIDLTDGSAEYKCTRCKFKFDQENPSTWT